MDLQGNWEVVKLLNYIYSDAKDNLFHHCMFDLPCITGPFFIKKTFMKEEKYLE